MQPRGKGEIKGVQKWFHNMKQFIKTSKVNQYINSDKIFPMKLASNM